ncbi:MAG TPA: tetratricopeptide repeat protein [Firmicutes bacterium]|nr:tetratricopeptide repeat protein [Bacillota bacterium]
MSRGLIAWLIAAFLLVPATEAGAGEFLERWQAAYRWLTSYQAAVEIILCLDEDTCQNHQAEVIVAGPEQLQALYTGGALVGQEHLWQGGLAWVSRPNQEGRIEQAMVTEVLAAVQQWLPMPGPEAAVAEESLPAGASEEERANGGAGRAGEAQRPAVALIWEEPDGRHRLLLDEATGLPLAYMVPAADGEEQVLGIDEEGGAACAAGAHCFWVKPPGWNRPIDLAVLRVVEDGRESWRWQAVNGGWFRLVYSEVGERQIDLPSQPALTKYLQLRDEGYALLAAGDYTGAAQVLSAATAVAPYLAAAHADAGDAFFAAGRLHQARVRYEQALMLNPMLVRVMNNLAYALAEDQLDLRKARRLVEMSLMVEPNNPAYIDTLGWVLILSGQPEKGEEVMSLALEVWEQCGEDCPEDLAVGLAHLALARYRQGDAEGAAELMRRALALYPDMQIPLNLRDEYRLFTPEVATGVSGPEDEP